MNSYDDDDGYFISDPPEFLICIKPSKVWNGYDLQGARVKTIVGTAGGGLAIVFQMPADKDSYIDVKRDILEKLT